MKINVMGATGQLGRKVIQALRAQGAAPEDLIASVRSPEKAQPFLEQGLTVRRADYDQPDTLAKAFRDTEVLLLIPSTAPVEPRVVQHANALDAARLAGVRRIAFASFAAARPTSKFLIAPFLLYAESKLRLSGMAWTILRDGMYLDPLADWAPDLAEMGRLPYPVAQGRVAYIARHDLARALAAVCLNTGHDAAVYELTGPEAVSMPELAAALSEAMKQPLVYNQVTEEEFAALCRTANVPDPVIEVLASMYRAVDNGEFEHVTDHVERLTGSPPQTVAAYLQAVL